MNRRCISLSKRPGGNRVVELREITPENFEAVMVLRVTETQKPFVSSVETALAKAWVYRNTAFPFAVYADNAPVGFIMLGYYAEKKQYTVWEFLIDEKFQKCGYGRQALQLGINWLRQRFGVNEVFLGCKHENTAAEKLYASAGFQRTGFETETGFEMRLCLSESK